MDQPTDIYIDSWKSFRDESDEDDKTAIYIRDSAFWPTTKSISIMDIGCGDGRVAKRLLSLEAALNKIVLIDPDPVLLGEAKQKIGKLCKSGNVTAEYEQSEIKGDLLAPFDTPDAIIIVHVVYLLDGLGPLRSFLQALPKNVPVFVVIDNPKSIFTTLWKETAPKYHARVQRLHEFFSNIPADDFDIEKGEITSSLPDPTRLPTPVRNSVISHIGYFNAEKSGKKILDNAIDIISDRCRNGRLYCYSSCYQLMRV